MVDAAEMGIDLALRAVRPEALGTWPHRLREDPDFLEHHPRVGLRGTLKALPPLLTAHGPSRSEKMSD